MMLEEGLERTVRWYEENRWWWEPVRFGAYRDYYQTFREQRSGRERRAAQVRDIGTKCSVTSGPSTRDARTVRHASRNSPLPIDSPRSGRKLSLHGTVA
jgi:hypothetical protein